MLHGYTSLWPDLKAEQVAAITPWLGLPVCHDHSLDSSFWSLTLNYIMGLSRKHCLVLSHNHITDGTQMLSHASSLSTARPPEAGISVLMI